MGMLEGLWSSEFLTSLGAMDVETGKRLYNQNQGIGWIVSVDSFENHRSKLKSSAWGKTKKWDSTVRWSRKGTRAGSKRQISESQFHHPIGKMVLQPSSIVAVQDWSYMLRCKLIITLMPPKMRRRNTKTATRNAPKNMCSTGRGIFLRLLPSDKSTSLPNFWSWLGTYSSSCQCSDF
jgi:hypothetical protein